MSQAADPCGHWAVFRMLGDARHESSSQISVVREGEHWRLYCCYTLRTRDMAGQAHVLSVGVDLVPALLSHDANGADIADGIGEECLKRGGQAKIGRAATETLRAVAHILNIAWVEESLRHPARIICPRSSRCPRLDQCNVTPARVVQDITDVKREILAGAKG